MKNEVNGDSEGKQDWVREDNNINSPKITRRRSLNKETKEKRQKDADREKQTHHISASDSNQSNRRRMSFDMAGVIALSVFGRLNVNCKTCGAGNATSTSEERGFGAGVLVFIPGGERVGAIVVLQVLVRGSNASKMVHNCRRTAFVC